MHTWLRQVAVSVFIGSLAGVCLAPAGAQTGATSGTITGTVSDPTGAVVPGATAEIQNPVSQYERAVATDSAGHFQFSNVPYNSYHLTVDARGFNAFVQDVRVQSSTPVIVPVSLSVGTAATTVQVTGEDLVNNAANMDTDIDRRAFAEIPLESTTSGLVRW